MMVSCFILTLVLLLVVLLNCTRFMMWMSKLVVVFLGFGLVPPRDILYFFYLSINWLG